MSGVRGEPLPAGYQVPVLMYHQVLRSRSEAGPVGSWILEADLRRQLEYLVRHRYEAVTFRDLAGAGPALRRRVILTFDDGTEDAYTRLFPLLRALGLRAVVFAVTGLSSNAWDVPKGEPERRLLTLAQVREMAAHGVEFGGHTRTHVNFDLVTPEVARAEIAGCKADLEEWLGVPAVSFAYPHGAVHPHVKRLVAEAGFRWGVATRRGPAELGADPLEVRRTAVSHRTGMARFRLKVSGRYHQPLYGFGRWLGLRG